MKMKFQPVISTALMLGLLTCSLAVNTTQVLASSAKKPYCTAASNQGSSWWTWTSKTVEDACFTAFTKVLGSGASVDRAAWGTYYTDALNKAKLSCKQGTKEVLGTGVQVFENGINMRKTSNWSGCTLQITN